MLNDRQKETLEQLSILRKEVELLESHKKVFADTHELVHITPKQYEESGKRIEEKVAEIEKEYGIYEEPNTVNRALKEIGRGLKRIEIMLYEWSKNLDEQYYNAQVQLTIDEVIDEIDAKNA